MTDLSPRARLEVAAAVGAHRLLEVWAEVVREGSAADELRLLVAERLLRAGEASEALSVLRDAGTGVRRSQLEALALDLRREPGDADRSLEILETLRAQGELDGETLGLLAGRYKRRAWESDNPHLIDAAFTLYQQAWEETGDTYPGINAAALALEVDEPEESQRLAREVLAALDSLPPASVDQWSYATRAEAHLLLQELLEARRWYRRAVSADPNAVQSISAMRIQARRSLRLLGLDEEALDRVLRLRRVVAFSGHMVDAPDRPTPRFPPALEGEVRATIREHLRSLDAGFGFASGAKGGDILFLEELLERGARANVYLPFPLDDFLRTSVGSWEPRLRAVLEDPRTTLHVLGDSLSDASDRAAAYAACNDAIRAGAQRMAGQFHDRPSLLALWDEMPGDGSGGTGDAVASWSAASLPVEILPLPGRDPAARTPDAAPNPAPGPDRSMVRRPASAPATALRYPRRYCLTVGIDAYRDTHSWKTLRNARGDAIAVGSVLKDQYGFETRQLLGPEATWDAIGSAVARGLQPLVGPDDLVVIYFAGHGHTKGDPGGERGFIVPWDAEGEREDRLISVERLSIWSGALDCRHFLCIFDSCFSGTLQRLSGSDRRAPDPSYARLAITSGKANQPVLDGPAGGHSPFADALLSALRDGVPGSTDFITATELYTYLWRQVTGGDPAARQTPTLATLRNHEGGEIILARN